MCNCDDHILTNDHILTFENMIADPMFRMLLAADRVSLDEVTALYVRTGSAIAAHSPGPSRPAPPARTSAARTSAAPSSAG